MLWKNHAQHLKDILKGAHYQHIHTETDMVQRHLAGTTPVCGILHIQGGKGVPFQVLRTDAGLQICAGSSRGELVCTVTICYYSERYQMMISPKIAGITGRLVVVSLWFSEDIIKCSKCH